MQYLLTPLHTHYDYGFGSLGDSFRVAAERLDNDKSCGMLVNRRLPICYLYRHSAELYLKSAIMVLHRLGNLKGPNKQHAPIPFVAQGNGKAPMSLDRVHRLDNLVWHYNAMLSVVGR